MKTLKKHITYIKIIALSLTIGLVIGCNIIQVSNVQSQIHRPGLPSGKSTINYSWKLAVEESIEINSVSLRKENKLIKILSFVIYDLKDGRIINDYKLPKGNYYIKFEIPGSDLSPKEENIIELNYTNKNIKKSLCFKSTKVPDLLMR